MSTAYIFCWSYLNNTPQLHRKWLRAAACHCGQRLDPGHLAATVPHAGSGQYSGFSLSLDSACCQLKMCTACTCTCTSFTSAKHLRRDAHLQAVYCAACSCALDLLYVSIACICDTTWQSLQLTVRLHLEHSARQIHAEHKLASHSFLSLCLLSRHGHVRL